ncbi:two-component system sensor histidine kinase NtrB [Wenzhouxiangella marina]|uniref:histidine kinase n=1 Tax=Wenzhouxiangella marina TaxID=1579979 RepID=A0A0K0XXH9_9GAMM|nr:ATP-binding protein [Wenzhouxiangella marina]AKS42337.1 Histidine kinase [Wenzhouxiangella marina]MBB6085890.1 two-component system sensor histidine kinase PilS (NtrC family) [Wenzhouxiangella marina]
MKSRTSLVADEDIVRRALYYLNGFRIILAPIILVVALSPLAEQLTPGYKFFLLKSAALTYVGAAILFLLVHLRRTTSPAELSSFSLATDLIIISTVLHCFGGIESGLVILLLFYIGIAGLLLSLRTALFFASLVALGLLIDAVIAARVMPAATVAVPAALYGIAAMVTALGCSLLGRWGREYQLLAERRGVDMANLEQVNELIIHRMRSGVLVVDAAGKIRQINEAAWYLLGNPPVSERNLKVIAPALAERLERWRKTGKTEDEGLLLQATQVAVVPRMLSMPGVNSEATLIFLEDTSVVSRRARDLAQASLARLSASIAHEIRNPLGALSHAAQLLGESDSLSPPDQKLVKMILNHAARMNDIVENVLKLSRRERARVEAVNLVSWARRLANEFRRYHKLPEDQIKLELPSAGIMVLIDPGQLTQAVWNLMENALKHARIDENRPPVITLRVSPIRGHRELALDIIDDGPGIPLEKRSQVFEPFFTTHKQGSGLGLYLARQLCDANQAPLEYVQVPNTGACFRILLRRPEASDGTPEMVDQRQAAAR